jgi:hypothetical protein
MKTPGFIDRLDDWINPIVVKELRQAVQSRLVVSMLLLGLLLQLLIFGAMLLFRDARQGPDATDWYAGAAMFQIINGILLGSAIILIPAYTGIRMASERSDANPDLLFISSLRPRSIILGKFVAALVLALLVFSTTAPFITFAYLMRGIDIPTIATILLFDLLGVLFGTQALLFVGAIAANRGVKVAAMMLAFVGMILLFRTFLIETSDYVSGWGTGTRDPVMFWGIRGAFALISLSLVSLLFCWSVAIISPPASNRAVAGRICLIGQWLLTGLAAALFSYYAPPRGQQWPVIAWLYVSVFFSSLQFIISLNERVEWRQRVARTIPRNLLLRLPAFLLYSGAAGGISLAVLLYFLSMTGAFLWSRFLRDEFFLGVASAPSLKQLNVLLVVGLYVMCYGLTGMLLRTYVLTARVHHAYTWLIVFLLVGLGSAVPMAIALLAEPSYGPGRSDLQWWYLPNPFAAVYDVAAERNNPTFSEFEIVCFYFTGIWAATVTLLSIPWFVAQVARFHPLATRSKKGKTTANAKGKETALPILESS